MQEQDVGVELEPGDALIYLGSRMKHWREPYEGERQYQMFLHYVFKDGKYADLAFDERSGLKMEQR